MTSPVIFWTARKPSQCNLNEICPVRFIYTTLPAPPDFVGSISCDLYLANFAFRRPRWYSVAAEEEEDGHYLEKELLAADSLDTFVFLGALDFPFDLCYLLEDTHSRKMSKCPSLST